MKAIRVFILVFSFSFILFAQNQEEAKSDFAKWLYSKSELKIEIMEKDPLFQEAYQVMFPQPIDHFSTESDSFYQKLYVSFYADARPTILSTEGYTGRDVTLELSRIIGANQIICEHRYFGDSVPDTLDWQYLTVRQAAADHHEIIEFFKEYFDAKWLTTGISKGGQTVMFHRFLYPDDVDVSVPYVGPLNFSDTEDRIHEWLENVGTEECRERIIDFQIECLKNKDTLITMLKDSSKVEELTYAVGYEEAFEYMVLEYSFAFWQWTTGDCSIIPTDSASIDEMYNHLFLISPMDFFSDQDINALKPFYYQAFTEIGFYNYDTEPFEEYLEYSDGSIDVWWQDSLELTYTNELMYEIDDWLKTDAERFIFIYGGNDPWSAPQAMVEDNPNILKYVLPGGSHRTRIRHLTDENKQEINQALEEWLDIELLK